MPHRSKTSHPKNKANHKKRRIKKNPSKVQEVRSFEGLSNQGGHSYEQSSPQSGNWKFSFSHILRLLMNVMAIQAVYGASRSRSGSVFSFSRNGPKFSYNLFPTDSHNKSFFSPYHLLRGGRGVEINLPFPTPSVEIDLKKINPEVVGASIEEELGIVYHSKKAVQSFLSSLVGDEIPGISRLRGRNLQATGCSVSIPTVSTSYNENVASVTINMAYTAACSFWGTPGTQASMGFTLVLSPINSGQLNYGPQTGLVITPSTSVATACVSQGTFGGKTNFLCTGSGSFSFQYLPAAYYYNIASVSVTGSATSTGSSGTSTGAGQGVVILNGVVDPSIHLTAPSGTLSQSVANIGGATIIPLPVGAFNNFNQVPVTYSLSPSVSWASINAATGTLTLNPQVGNQGTQTFTIAITNTGNAANTASVQWPIVVPDHAPQSGSFLINPINFGSPFNVTIPELTLFSDPDGIRDICPSGGLPCRVTLVTSSTSAWMTFNAATGVLSGTPPAAGTYIAELVVTDTVGETATTPLTVVINPSLSFSETAVAQIIQGATTALPGYVVTTPSNTATVTLSLTQSAGSFQVNPAISGVTVIPSSGQSVSGQLQISGPTTAVNTCLASLAIVPTVTNRNPFTVSATAVDALGQSSSSTQQVSVNPVNHPLTSTTIEPSVSNTNPTAPTSVIVSSANLVNIDNVLWKVVSVNVTSGSTVVASNSVPNGWSFSGLNGSQTNQQAQLIVTPPAGSEATYSMSLGVQPVDGSGNPLAGMPILNVNTSPFYVNSAAISVPPAALTNIGVGEVTSLTLPAASTTGDTLVDQITNLPVGWSYNPATCVVIANAKNPGSISLIRTVCAAHAPAQCTTQTYTTVAVSSLSTTSTNISQLNQGQTIALTGLSVSSPAANVTVTLSVSDATAASFLANSTTAGVTVVQGTGQLSFSGSAVALNAYFTATPPQLMGSQTNRSPIGLTIASADSLGQTTSSSKQISVNSVNHPLTSTAIAPTISNTNPTVPTSILVSSANLVNIDNVLWKIVSVNVTSGVNIIASNSVPNGWSFSGLNGSPTNQQTQLIVTPPAGSEATYSMSLGIQPVDSSGNPLAGMPIFNLNTNPFSVGSAAILVPAQTLPAVGVGQNQTVILPAATTVGDSVIDTITNLPTGWSYNAATRALTMSPTQTGTVILTRVACAAHDPSQCASQTYSATAVAIFVVNGVMNAQSVFRGRSFTEVYPSTTSLPGFNVTLSLEDTTGAPAPAWLQPNPITGVASGVVPLDALSTYNLVPVYTAGNQVVRLAPFTLSTAVALTVQVTNSGQVLFQENQVGTSLPAIVVSAPVGQNVTATVLIPILLGMPVINLAVVGSSGIEPTITPNEATGNYEFLVAGTQSQVNAHLANIGLNLAAYYFGSSQVQVVVNDGIDPEASTVATVNVVHVNQPPYLANPVVVPDYTVGNSFFISVPTTTWGLRDQQSGALVQYDNTTGAYAAYEAWSPAQLGYSITSPPVGSYSVTTCASNAGGSVCAVVPYRINPQPGAASQSWWDAHQQYFQYAGYAAGGSPIAYKIYTILSFLIAGYVQDRRSKKKLEATKRFRDTLKREYPGAAKDAIKIEVENEAAGGAREGAEFIAGETGSTGQLLAVSKRDVVVEDLGILADQIMLLASGDKLKGQKDTAERLIARFDLWAAKAALNDPSHDDLPRGLEIKLLEVQHRVGELIESALIDEDYDEETVLLARFNLALLEFLFFLKAIQGRPLKVDRQIEMLNQLLASPGVREQWYLKYLKRVFGFTFFCCAKRFSKTYQLKDEVKLPLKTGIALITRFPNTDSLMQKIGRLTKWITPGGTRFVPPAILWEDQVERLRIMALFARRERSILVNIIRDYLAVPDSNPHLLKAYQMTLAILAEEAARDAEKTGVPLSADATLQDRKTLRKLVDAASTRALIEKAAEIRQKTFFVIHAGKKPYLDQIIAEHADMTDLEMLMVYNTCLKNIAETSVSRERRAEALAALRHKGALAASYLPSSMVLCVPRVCCQPRQGRKLGKSSRLFQTVPVVRGDSMSLQANPLSGEAADSPGSVRSVRLSTYSAAGAGSASSKSLRGTLPGGRRKSFSQLGHLVGNPILSPARAASEDTKAPAEAVTPDLVPAAREGVPSADSSTDDGAASTSSDSSASSGDGRREVLRHARTKVRVRPLTMSPGRESSDAGSASPAALFYRSPIMVAGSATATRPSRSSMAPAPGVSAVRRGSAGPSSAAGTGMAGMMGALTKSRADGRRARVSVSSPAAAAGEAASARQRAGASV